VESPAAFVGEVMMAPTKRYEIVDVGHSVLQRVPSDVVGLGVLERHLAQRTSPIQDP